jgi:predicted nucleotidyltransferase
MLSSRPTLTVDTDMTTSSTRLRDLLEGQPGIRQALVFGSVASGDAGPGSDLDIAVEANHPLDAAEKARLIEVLAAATGRPVDLIDLKTVGEPLLGQILKHGQRILGSNADHAALIRRHVFNSEDFQPYIDRMLLERRRAWIG